MFLNVEDLKCCGNCKFVLLKKTCAKISKESALCENWDSDDKTYKDRIGKVDIFSKNLKNIKMR